MNKEDWHLLLFLLLSHHRPEQLHRTIHVNFRGRNVYLCARCTGEYSGILSLFIAWFFGFEFPAWLYLPLISTLPLPSAFDWVTQSCKLRESRNTIRISTGFLLGITKGLFLLGEKSTETHYKEHGCVYKIDLRKAYFSPRLSYERLRIAELIQPGEVVLNMFAGVGCYSISIAKHSEPLKVYSVDINPSAFQYLHENIRLNRVADVVVPIQGDAKKVTEKELQNVADRVLMPLPERAYEYLDYAMLALKPTGGWIHYYGFEYAKKNENPVEKAEAKVSEKMRMLCSGFQVEFGRIVRPIGPRWYQVVLDIHVKN